MPECSSHRIEDWITGTEDLGPIHELRYAVLVEEIGKYHDQADHASRRLVDEEDALSWHTVATTAPMQSPPFKAC